MLGPDEQANWIHGKAPGSIKENTYGTDRFAELFAAIFGSRKPASGRRSWPACERKRPPGRLMELT